MESELYPNARNSVEHIAPSNTRIHIDPPKSFRRLTIAINLANLWLAYLVMSLFFDSIIFISNFTQFELAFIATFMIVTTLFIQIQFFLLFIRIPPVIISMVNLALVSVITYILVQSGFNGAALVMIAPFGIVALGQIFLIYSSPRTKQYLKNDLILELIKRIHELESQNQNIEMKLSSIIR